MARIRSLFALALLATLVVPALAEKVDMSPDDLRSTATHVIVGKVSAIYARTESGGDWRYTHYVAEARVLASEKGEGLKKGDLVYVRYWRRAWIGKSRQPPSTSGHRGLPGVGATVRIYVAKNAYDGFSFDNKDGGFNVIGANGFEEIKPERRK
jgi:hypothetical protein